MKPKLFLHKNNQCWTWTKIVLVGAPACTFLFSHVLLSLKGDSLFFRLRYLKADVLWVLILSAEGSDVLLIHLPSLGMMTMTYTYRQMTHLTAKPSYAERVAPCAKFADKAVNYSIRW